MIPLAYLVVAEEATTAVIQVMIWSSLAEGQDAKPLELPSLATYMWMARVRTSQPVADDTARLEAYT